VDLAACCTNHEEAACADDLGEAYGIIHNHKTAVDGDEDLKMIMSHLTKAVRKRISADKIKPNYLNFYNACSDDAGCTSAEISALQNGGGDSSPSEAGDL